MSDIRILDACCGSRMFWFDKQEPHTTYMDRREEEFEIHKKKINVKPDIVADFRDMPFDDETFNLVVFDPPHLLWAGQKFHACSIWTTRLIDLEIRPTTRF